ncbi:MAG: hypothetical protein V1816_28175 [Pseudomonadota bacterium]
MNRYGFPMLFFIVTALAVGFLWAVVANLRQGKRENLSKSVFGFVALAILAAGVFSFWDKAAGPDQELSAIIQPVPDIKSVVSKPFAEEIIYLRRNFPDESSSAAANKAAGTADKLRVLQWTIDTGLSPWEVHDFYLVERNLRGWKASGEGEGVFHFRKGPAWLIISYVGLPGPERKMTRIVYSYTPRRE